MKKQIYPLASLPRLWNFPFQIQRLGWMPKHQFRHRNSILEHIFICFVFNCNYRGPITYTNDHLVQVEHRDFFQVFYPGTRLHSIYAPEHDEIFFIYNAELESQFRNLNLPLTGEIHLSNHAKHLLEKLQKTLQQLYTPGMADRTDLLALELIHEVLINHTQTTQEQTHLNLAVQNIASYLSTHFHEAINLDHLLMENGISKRTFYREWHNQQTLTPLQFLREHRLGLVQELLVNSSYTIEEIIAQCGYTSRILFFRDFKHKYNCSPMQYRRQANPQIELNT